MGKLGELLKRIRAEVAEGDEYQTGLEGKRLLTIRVVACQVLGRRVHLDTCVACRYHGALKKLERGKGAAPKYTVTCCAPRKIAAEDISMTASERDKKNG
jgi:hypothetical protein